MRKIFTQQSRLLEHKKITLNGKKNLFFDLKCAYHLFHRLLSITG